MGIDRAEEADAPEPGPGRGADADAESRPDRAELAAEHARHRSVVDHAYAARDAWTQALPSLRSAWEEHAERYPERTGTGG